MKVSIIIPTYNRTAQLALLLESLANQTNADFQTVISIDGDPSKCRELLNSKNWNLRDLLITTNPNKNGRGANRNNGARQATGDILIFFDDDMEFIPTAVEKHVNFQTKNPNSILVGSQLEDPLKMVTDIQKFKATLSKKWMESVPKEQNKIENLFLTGANFSIEKEKFQRLGMFNEDLSDGEDFELGIRAMAQNIKLYFDSEIIGWHNDLISLTGFIKRQKEYENQRKKIFNANPQLVSPGQNASATKRIFQSILKAKLFVFLIDNFNIFLLFPKFIRFKLYDLIITSHLN